LNVARGDFHGASLHTKEKKKPEETTLKKGNQKKEEGKKKKKRKNNRRKKCKTKPCRTTGRVSGRMVLRVTEVRPSWSLRTGGESSVSEGEGETGWWASAGLEVGYYGGWGIVLAGLC